MPHDALHAAVASALAELGAHRAVPFTVDEVTDGAGTLHVALTLSYRRASPVCCGEPGCYVPFLGRRRAEVPAALGRALGLPRPPRVSMSVALRFEPGYAHVEHATGRPTGQPAADGTLRDEPEHFAPGDP